MLGGSWEWIKTHPFWTAGLVVAFIVLWYMLRSGGSSSGVSANDATNAAQIAASGQLQANYQNTQAAVALGGQQADVQKAAIAAQADVTNKQTEAAVNVATIQSGMYQALANYAYMTAQNGNATSVDLAKVQADVSKTQTQAAVTMNAANLQGALDLAKIQIPASVTLAKIGMYQATAGQLPYVAGQTPGSWSPGLDALQKELAALRANIH